LKVAIPTTLTAKQKQLLEEFSAEEEGKGSNSWAGKFFAMDIDKAWKRVKDFLASRGGAGASSASSSEKKKEEAAKDSHSA
jgi:bisphosphoglycerate-independent phosphoglycerate mutase (AlkP superfamily)